MKKREKILLIILSIVVFSCIIAGLSFAYFRATTTINNENSTTLATQSIYLELTFADGTPEISATEIAPGWSESKTFTVTNTGEGTTFYSIKLFEIVNPYVAGGIKYSISSSDGGEPVDKTVLPSEDTIIGTNVRIGVGVTHTYTITAYYDNLDNTDQTSDMGKTFSFKVGIVGRKDEFAIRDPNTAILGDDKGNVTSPPITTPGRLISSTNEAEISSAADDYGTSYYYRGNVTNNYLVFANMCWRIVRITGLDDLKIILYNYNPNNVDNPCDITQDGTSNAFARYSGSTYTGHFNNTNFGNAYVGFMYGSTGSSTYAGTHANTNKSTILTALETWYQSKIGAMYEPFLADVIWCNDKSIDYAYPYGTNNGIGINSTGYSARGRIYTDNSYQTSANPTLICPNDSNGGKLSKFTADETYYGNGALTYKIGLLTIDEAAYAGLIYNSTNTSSYLTKNATSDMWWTTSPSMVNKVFGQAQHWGVKPDGSLFDYEISVGQNPTRAIRPVIALKSSVLLSGAGTSDNPYIVAT